LNKLYFSSNGHGGLGKLDFFSSVFDGLEWSLPENLEKINSTEDELFIFPQNPNLIFFSSNRRSGNYNIFSATRPEKSEIKKDEPFSTYQFSFFNINTGETAVNYSINITNNEGIKLSEGKIRRLRSNQFSAQIPCKNSYKVHISFKDFLNYDEKITIDSCGNFIPKKIYLYSKESVFKLNIPFNDTNTTLNVYSIQGLDTAYAILYNNPEVNAEIAVHTDSTVEWSKSILLTLQRAESIKNYLVEKGISPSRLKSKGYGSLEPLAPNSTEEGRKLNRRVELRLQRK
jgi:OmpA-OmpF porin, OOP family